MTTRTILLSVGLISCCPLYSDADEQEPRLGFEIIHIKSPNSFIVWATMEITEDEFKALEIPLGWIKNQPREPDADRGSFRNSPGQTPGTFIDKELFGFHWRHVATITQIGRRIDPDGLLQGAVVTKSHVMRFDSGRRMTFLSGPSGLLYLRVSRDANRTDEDPTLPDGWKLLTQTAEVPIEFALPARTLVIRADNQDSFQGPVEPKVIPDK
ncbi:hypothetical protein [Stratiformator vulcanicus]|nr:hypothetical protein [Stratiformator vulcanicus]